MKTTIKNQYASANNALIFFVSILVGYNIYQEIFHPEKADLILCIVMIIFTAATIQENGKKAEAKE
ncbi:hypothetical protein KYG33_14820 [Chryseobacterium sp. D764]|jgi:hypothetical protein|uniref:hypothetical protein n=1 Tax=unclassified Chryseobacterium TaxID=2593645 RepID=UPI000986C641|nr:MULTISPECIES: hypothetical protein [unclassified Chryseobacterium]QXU48062.1 hypothetical protein KYG33_14820 [Chryseobacterium sp. D764]CAD0222615.1 conserved protein of unknown function [Chryseobacterium sp. JV274]